MDDTCEGIERIKEYYSIVSNDGGTEIVESAEDITHVHDQGLYGVIIGCQSSRIIDFDLDWIPIFKKLGLRILQLTYSERNFVGDGCLEPSDAGLSHFGKQLVKKANQHGLVIDLSHASDNTAKEAIGISEFPCIVSHAGLRSQVGSLRTVPDDVLELLAENGGVLGVTSHPHQNWVDKSRRPTFDDFLDNIEYAIELMGIDHVGIGTDYVARLEGYPTWVADYLDETYSPYRPDNQPNIQSVLEGRNHREHQLDGFEGIHDLPKLTNGLLERGYDESEIKQILGENFLRVFDIVWNDE
jgi:membrane dipeptidase